MLTSHWILNDSFSKRNHQAQGSQLGMLIRGSLVRAQVEEPNKSSCSNARAFLFQAANALGARAGLFLNLI